MPGRIVIRPEVREDLREVADHFARRGHISEVKVGTSFLATVDRLALMPELGSQKSYGSRRLEGVRLWFIHDLPKILIFYRLLADGIEILAVFHGAQHQITSHATAKKAAAVTSSVLACILLEITFL